MTWQQKFVRAAIAIQPYSGGVGLDNPHFRCRTDEARPDWLTVIEMISTEASDFIR